VHEQQKDVSTSDLCFWVRLLTAFCSTKVPRAHIVECWTETRNMQRSYSSSDGCTTSKATVTQARIRLSSTWSNRSAQVRTIRRNCNAAPANVKIQITLMRKAGICWVAATWPSRSSQRLMRPTTSGLSRWQESDILVLDRCALLPDQPVSGCT
jgi:hypothetical protein